MTVLLLNGFPAFGASRDINFEITNTAEVSAEPVAYHYQYSTMAGYHRHRRNWWYFGFRGKKAALRWMGARALCWDDGRQLKLLIVLPHSRVLLGEKDQHPRDLKSFWRSHLSFVAGTAR